MAQPSDKYTLLEVVGGRRAVGTGQCICVNHRWSSSWVSKHPVQNISIAVFISQCCRYTSSEFFWWYAASAH